MSRGWHDCCDMVNAEFTGTNREAKIMREIRKVKLKRLLVAVVMICVLPGNGFAQDVFIAGTSPDKRPENAPVITSAKKPDGWYGKALSGVSQPYPYSLRFLENQGGWFTPFIRPGMTGPYDIRRWHTDGTRGE